jgi:hypothetical protein
MVHYVKSELNQPGVQLKISNPLRLSDVIFHRSFCFAIEMLIMLSTRTAMANAS